MKVRRGNILKLVRYVQDQFELTDAEWRAMSIEFKASLVRDATVELAHYYSQP